MAFGRAGDADRPIDAASMWSSLTLRGHQRPVDRQVIVVGHSLDLHSRQARR
jgi:hypothetical protein